MDVLFLIDESGSIGGRNFEKVKQFIAAFIKSLPISVDDVNTALLTFASRVRLHWGLKSPLATNKELAVERALRLPYGMGGTDTAAGLSAAYNQLYTSAKLERAAVPKLVILLTDGKSESVFATKATAAKLREKGAVIAVLGVGYRINTMECRWVAGCPEYGPSPCSLFLQSNWEQLVSNIDPMLKEVCKKMPKDAVCTEWSEWSPCSASCGTGQQHSSRREISPPEPGTPTCPTCEAPMGSSCEQQGGLERTRDCDAGICPVDAGCGYWGAWTEWSSTCGSATRKRTRIGYNQPAAQGAGLPCELQSPPVKREEVQTTMFSPCVVVPPTPPDWGEWSECSVSCGGGKRHRTRSGLSPSQATGKSGASLFSEQYPGYDLYEEGSCNESPCPVNAECGEFGEWSICSVSCGGGISVRDRAYWRNNQKHGGLSCLQQFPEGPHQEKVCNTEPCPVDEVPGPWEEWSQCSVTCGQGVQVRNRGRSAVPAQFGGRTIAKQNESLPKDKQILLHEERACSMAPCGASCTFPFTEWSKCQYCENGRGLQVRHTTVAFDYQDRPCDAPTFETRSCTDCPASVPPAVVTPVAPTPSPSVSPTTPETNVPGGGGEGSAAQPGEEEKEREERTGAPAAAIAGGVVGGLLLLAAAGGGGYYFTHRGGEGVGRQAEIEYDHDAGTNVTLDEDKEAMVEVDEDSGMWADDR
ncbi:microneme protein [Cystoisospora suis]|uniref:Microneme protein n=1 Tax=Cystoisospora suis TaxID=483139 RepID=A0A2C6L698_9APIC|nr:microneme protein [Cystoisospora suis]